MQKQDVLKNIEKFVEDQLGLLKPIAESWQPSDFLPDMTAADWQDKINGLRDKAAGLSDDVLVALAGNLITEEALPSYQTWQNRIKGLRDETGASQTPWGLWTRGWTAEENRHGDLLNKYLYLSGRVDMRAVEITIQHLIRNGFDLKSDNDPYRSLIYTSFQERATKISHANTGRLADKCGDALLNKICSQIAADEARHEEAYKRVCGRIFEADPDGALLAFEEMMRIKVVMPARLMSDGTNCDLFTQFAISAQRSKMYTSLDYADIISHLVGYWKIASLKNLTPEAAKAQEYLCGLSDFVLSKAEKTARIVDKLPKEPFTWIFNRTA